MKVSKIELTITKMDLLYNTDFSTGIRDQKNISITANKLREICNDYSVHQIVNAVKWITKGWRFECLVFLVSYILKDFDIFKIALFIDIFANDWENRFLAELINHVLLIWDKDMEKLHFINLLTKNWEDSRTDEVLFYINSFEKSTSRVIQWCEENS
jgi:hypothetical protein